MYNLDSNLSLSYRLIPTFGRDTIRRFTRNTSSLKKLAARDWEDMLQVSIPIFEDLLPAPCNNIILDLLFTLCTWHAYAKLRLHTTGTITSLSAFTTLLGTMLRRFKNKVCTLYHTRELPREEAARGRRTAALAGQAKGKGRARTTAPANSMSGTSRTKKFNMATYKLHALGDYVAAIIAFGPTDNYSTQVVSPILTAPILSTIYKLILHAGRTRAPPGQTLLRANKQGSICTSDSEAATTRGNSSSHPQVSNPCASE